MIAVIIGNGRSLEQVDFRLLKKYPTFGCNYILEVFVPTYYTIFDDKVAENWEYVRTLDRGITFVYRGWIERSTDPKNSHLAPIQGAFPLTGELLAYPDSDIYTGTAVTQNLKLAYWMGYTTAYLVGCDWGVPQLHHRGMVSYEEIEKERPAVPYNIDRHERELNEALEKWTDVGRSIYNLSPDTQMPVIPTKSMELII